MKTTTLIIRRSLVRPVIPVRTGTGGRAGFSVGGLLAILFAVALNITQAQDSWTQKADFAGIPRESAAGFSIGNKGYMGTGLSGTYPFFVYHHDFWEYDPALNAWSQKADFLGTGRYRAVGFSIGGKGYISTGRGCCDIYNDFWEYDPATNAWSQRADFGGTIRYGAAGFSIGSKGYIGTGNDPFNLRADFWEYDPVTDAWTQKANFGGMGRYLAVGFSIGSKGYIGTGHAGSYPYKKDFWEYDPSTNAWTQKADFGGTARALAAGFSIGNKGYIGTGAAPPGNDFWEYDPSTNSWTQKADFGGTGRVGAVGFSIGSKGYMGTGSVYPFTYYKDFWEYTPDNPSCEVPTNLSVTNITSSSAKLGWDAVAGAAGYKVRYKVSGTSEWTYHKITTGQSRPLNNLSPNTNYTWEVKTFCTINPGLSSDWSAKQHFTTAPLRMGDESIQQLSFQIYPNPAEDHATIQFTLAQPSHVCIKVYDVSGKETGTLLDAELQQGEHSLSINTNHFSKGVYTVKMISDFGIENQKLIVQ